jgi:AcrR family transcriptional regulator
MLAVVETHAADAGRKGADVAPRRYVSELRARQAQQTRMAVLTAARQMFVERGWAATGVRSVAEQAGVSVKTIYDAFGSKAELFKAVTDVAAAGDHEPVAVMEREQFAALAEGDLGQRAAAGARLALAVNRRTVDLMRVWRTAADTDAALAQMLTEDVERQRQTFVAAVTLIAGHEIERQRAEGLWALMNEESYRLLVRSCGWTDEQYERWLAETITRLLDTEQPQTR